MLSCHIIFLQHTKKSYKNKKKKANTLRKTVLHRQKRIFLFAVHSRRKSPTPAVQPKKFSPNPTIPYIRLCIISHSRLLFLNIIIIYSLLITRSYILLLFTDSKNLFSAYKLLGYYFITVLLHTVTKKILNLYVKI